MTTVWQPRINKLQKAITEEESRVNSADDRYPDSWFEEALSERFRAGELPALTAEEVGGITKQVEQRQEDALETLSPKSISSAFTGTTLQPEPPIDAFEAYRTGLVNKVAPVEKEGVPEEKEGTRDLYPKDEAMDYIQTLEEEGLLMGPLKKAEAMGALIERPTRSLDAALLSFFYKTEEGEPAWKAFNLVDSLEDFLEFPETGGYEQWEDPGIDLPFGLQIGIKGWFQAAAYLAVGGPKSPVKIVKVIEKLAKGKFLTKGEQKVFQAFVKSGGEPPMPGSAGPSKAQQLFKRIAAGETTTPAERAILEQFAGVVKQTPQNLLPSQTPARAVKYHIKQVGSKSFDVIETHTGKVMGSRKTKKGADSLLSRLQKQGGSTIMTSSQRAKRITDVADEVVDHLGGAPAESSGAITAASRKLNLWNKIGEKFKGHTNRTYRTENILLRADKYVDTGKIWQTIWLPIQNATNRQVGRITKRELLLRKFLKENDIQIGAMMNRTIETAGVKLTSFERVGLYLHSLNPQNLYHMVHGNLIPTATVEKVVASLTPKEQLIAQHLAKYFNKQTPIMQATVKWVGGKPMKPVENYFPLQPVKESTFKRIVSPGEELMDYDAFIITENKLRTASAQIQKGFIKTRRKQASQPVELDALRVWHKHLLATEHYKAFTPVITDLQQLLKKHRFREAFSRTQGKASLEVVDKWLIDVAKTNPLTPSNNFEAFLRTLRVNAVTAVLGLNIITAMKQFPSFFAGMAEIGSIQAMKGLFEITKHPVETSKLIRRYAPEIHKRAFEREIAELAAMKGAGKVIPGKMTPRQLWMILSTTIDRVTVNSIWRGGFDDALKPVMKGGKGMQPAEAAEYASRAIRRTQPYFGVKDIPEYWRGGELNKALLIFTNQLNQYWNYYVSHIIGKRKAGEISNLEVAQRLVQTFIIPAYTIGAISRSRPAEDLKEFWTDLSTMAIATIPLIGNHITQGIKGFHSSGLITVEFLDKIRELSYRLYRAEWDKVPLPAVEAAGYGLGIPVSQSKRTLGALLKMADGKLDDWMELIWGAYAREKAHPPIPERRRNLPPMLEDSSILERGRNLNILGDYR